MAGRDLLNAAILLVLTAAPIGAQSLGDIARQEEARRVLAKKAVKTLSDSDLGAGAIAQPAERGESSCYLSKSEGGCVSAERLVANSITGAATRQNAPLERLFRAEAESIRSQIEPTLDAMATLDSVIVDRTRSAGDRTAAETSLARARQRLASLERNWEKLAKALANQGLPQKWIEPAPPLTTVKQ